MVQILLLDYYFCASDNVSEFMSECLICHVVFIITKVGLKFVNSLNTPCLTS